MPHETHRAWDERHPRGAWNLLRPMVTPPSTLHKIQCEETRAHRVDFASSECLKFDQYNGSAPIATRKSEDKAQAAEVRPTR